MNHFAGLPWRIAAFAGLLVGAISFSTGAGPWTCLLRVSIAFGVFGAAGLALNLLLQADPPPASGRHSDRTVSEDAPPEAGPDDPPASTK